MDGQDKKGERSRAGNERAALSGQTCRHACLWQGACAPTETSRYELIYFAERECCKKAAKKRRQITDGNRRAWLHVGRHDHPPHLHPCRGSSGVQTKKRRTHQTEESPAAVEKGDSRAEPYEYSVHDAWQPAGSICVSPRPACQSSRCLRSQAVHSLGLWSGHYGIDPITGWHSPHVSAHPLVLVEATVTMTQRPGPGRPPKDLLFKIPR